MTPEQVLSQSPRVLTQAQREFYFREGYILLEAIIGDEWVNPPGWGARLPVVAARKQRASQSGRVHRSLPQQQCGLTRSAHHRLELEFRDMGARR